MERHVLDFRSLNFPTKPPYISKWEKPKENSVKINISMGLSIKIAASVAGAILFVIAALSLWQQGRGNLVISMILCMPKLWLVLQLLMARWG
jgi:hypothetical protein